MNVRADPNFPPAQKRPGLILTVVGSATPAGRYCASTDFSLCVARPRSSDTEVLAVAAGLES